ncbi:MAG: hypothetical protein DRN57_04225 [Thermoplasmata archaeon]|nr:MAG: hypothetical protein DRN57_04225 [Thermoplasmata archaeon]
MRTVRWISLLLALVCISPAVIIPAGWGLSLSGMTINISGSSSPSGESISTLFVILDSYYYAFLFLNLLPFVFLTINASIMVNIQWKRVKDIRKRSQKDSDNVPELFNGKAHPMVSIIIPCYNEAMNVSSTIASSYRQDYRGNIEIIVVDDGSRDDTWSISRIFKTGDKQRSVKVFHKSNGGKADALRYGIEKSTGDIIIMTDGDSVLHSNAVSSIVDTFHVHPDAGIVGGYVFIRNTHTGYLTKLQQLEYIITQHLIRINQSEDGSVLIAPGPVFGIRSDLARAIPPVDRTIVEDCDLTMSVLSTGYTTRSTTKAVAYTTAPATWSAWFKQRKRWIYGQFQAWRENRWHLKKNLWGLYTYFTWVSTTISAFLLGILLLVSLMFAISGGNYYRFIEFVSLRTGMVFLIYLLSRIIVLIQYQEGRRIILYIPLKALYDMVSGFLTAYLYMRYITRSGIRISWGNRTGVVQ